MSNVKKLNFGGRKTIDADDSVNGNPLIIIGAELTIPIQRLRIIATDFERSDDFPDAISLVEVVEGDDFESGDHLETPWGIVKIA